MEKLIERRTGRETEVRGAFLPRPNHLGRADIDNGVRLIGSQVCETVRHRLCLMKNNQ
ncbi:MAG TPA: hypothetical protein VNI58_08870 [Mariprofundaceae bacterium]|nr:hypothetical protein [Mariprofundaceae bacterium]